MTAVETTTAAPPPVTVRRSLRAGFWTVAVTSFLYLVAVSAPSPLYGVYAARWHFSPITLTAVFGVYAITLLVTMLLAGSLSDAIGRRPVMVAALLVQIAAMALFLAADGVAWLYAARLVQGCATGLITAAVSAALVDLQPPGRPGLGALVNSTVPAAGLAVGGLLSGGLVQYAPAPTTLIYWLLLGTFAVLVVLIPLLVPETVQRRGPVRLDVRIGVDRHVRRAFLAVTPVLLAVWAINGLYMSLGPSLAETMTHHRNTLLGGSVIFVLAGCGCAAALALHSWDAGRAMRAGCVLLGAGALMLAAAVGFTVPALLFAATVVSGCGFGAGFLGAFRTLLVLAAPERRSALISAVYVVAYVSFSLPSVIAGAVATRAGLPHTAIGYALVVAALAVGALPATARHCAPR